MNCRTVACSEKWGGGAQSNFPTRDHQNIFNLILTYIFIYFSNFFFLGGGVGGHGPSGPYRRYGYELPNLSVNIHRSSQGTQRVNDCLISIEITVYLLLMVDLARMSVLVKLLVKMYRLLIIQLSQYKHLKLLKLSVLPTSTLFYWSYIFFS